MKQSREFTMLRCVHGKAEKQLLQVFLRPAVPFFIAVPQRIDHDTGYPAPSCRTNAYSTNESSSRRIVRIREGLCPGRWLPAPGNWFSSPGIKRRCNSLPPNWKKNIPDCAPPPFPATWRTNPPWTIWPGALLELPAAKTLLINNAGAGDYGEFSEGSWDRIRTLLRLNVESLTRLCHAMIPGLKRNGGDIINISSLAALLPIPDFAVYAATKAYVSSLSEALRLELKEHGIRVLAVCPGPVSTGFGKAARRPGFTGQHDAGQKRL